MDENRFDHLTRWVSTGGNRRRILALLSSLPLGGIAGLLTDDDQADAKRRQKKTRQRKQRNADSDKSGAEKEDVEDDALPHKKRCRRVKGKGHGHHGRRKNCQAHHGGKGKGKDKKKVKDQLCEPESLAQTCANTCGSVQNNCQLTVDCGSCACNPVCPACQVCDEVLGQCQPDLTQDGQRCAGCQICDNGQCIPDPAIVCSALDQCHEAGVCDPATGECTNPAKANGTSCDDGDLCTTGDVCQDGVCIGTPKDCAAEADICNDAVCRSDGTCGKNPKPDGTSCNADNNSCTAGDSCQSGVCTPGAGVNCSSLNDDCNTGTCRSADGQCIKQAKADGTPCGTDGACQTGVCQEVLCRELGEGCNPNNNRCCQDNPTTCAVLAPSCYLGGEPQDARCCRATRDTCAADCECCGIAGCENGTCCNHPGGACAATTDCCTNRVDATCVSGTCCVAEGQFCEEDADCCSGSCPDGFCTGCLPLQAECESADECCQTGGQTLCRTSFDFNSVNCCKPKGGTCSGNNDCCDGRACTNGRCCEGEHFACESNADCCSGLECRNGLCRTNICLEPGESCPSGSLGCCPGGATCSDGTCCYQIGETCERSVECCRSNGFTACGGQNGTTCCIQDFGYAFNDDAACSSHEQCCSGFCYQNRSMCCRPQGASCTEIGALGFECCPYLGLTCSANGTGTCIPCRKPGESCTGSGTSSTCCLGSDCQNGTCVVENCGTLLAPCQDDSTCCPGWGCNTQSAVCLRVCQAEGEFCDEITGFRCCGGLTCTGEYPSQRCTRP